MTKDEIEKYGLFSQIYLNIPDQFKVNIQREEDFTLYYIFSNKGEQILGLYFGNYPQWPPDHRWFDKRYASTNGDIHYDFVSYWSLLKTSKQVWISRSSSHYGIHAWYTHRKSQNSAIADKIIESIQPPSKPNG